MRVSGAAYARQHDGVACIVIMLRRNTDHIDAGLHAAADERQQERQARRAAASGYRGLWGCVQ